MTSGNSVSSAASVRLHASQGEVFTFLADPRNTPRWLKSVEYVAHRPPGPIRAGTEVLCRVTVPGAKLQARYTYLDVSEPLGLSGRASAGGFHYNDSLRLARSTREGCTDVTWTVTIGYPPILRYGASYAGERLPIELERMLQNLQEVFAQPGSSFAGQ